MIKMATQLSHVHTTSQKTQGGESNDKEDRV